MASATGLTTVQEKKLTELFHKLDSNGDGDVDLQEFKQLGKAITGKEPTDAEVRAQLQRADADGNDKLDLEEWLSFGTVLATMDDAQFAAMIDGFIARLDATNAGTGGK